MANEVFEYIGKALVVSGSASVVAYQAFKHFAAKWLDARFQKNFQQLVHDQNKEIERLKNDLTKSFDRATKLNQREFDVLPQIWDQVSEAYWATASLVSPLQTISDLNRMQPKQLAAFVAESEILDWQKDDVLASSDKTKAFNDIIYWHRLNRVQQSHRAANIALSRSGIFVQDDIKEKLQAILDLVRGALIEDEMNHEHPSGRFSERLHNDIDRIRSDGRIWMSEAEKLIKTRLWADDGCAP
jgi:hypothetical protein